MKLADCRVGIVGLGLMGGSMAEALHGQCRRLIGIDIDREIVAAAAGETVDEATLDLAEAIPECDLVVLAVPVRTILDLVGEMGDGLPAPARLLDLGSTKRQIVRAMEALPAETDPVGGHPMCGREVGGFGARDGRLYEGSRFILTPLERSSNSTVALIGELVGAIGAREVRLNPDEHDELVATGSHLPYLLAAALIERARGVSQHDSRLEQLLASGFRDTTRLAASDPAMMIDILLTNKDSILRELEALQLGLTSLQAHLREGEETALLAHLTEIKEQKDRWHNGDNKQEGADGPQPHWPSA